ncbi:hypothetical protein C4D60_Mb06t26610 [Musa balbisiana]|uniref:non-specific serine/threonine protein kinase n=1 Tax=Musa balbisiana TaxID=52838 RepID=A0A4S8IQW7_MUSBA|nr:hypothetical protein C4D60_Mb06t26610 [Musa balbisiana]
MDKYEMVKDLGSGNFGVARLLRNKETKELVAIKYIPRGQKARYFFQQLICGVSYCHYMQICHRDLKLENTLLDGSPAPRLKICDFGYSKSSLLHSRPKSTVGTPAYIAPEVLSRREYDGKVSSVISGSLSASTLRARRPGLRDHVVLFPSDDMVVGASLSLLSVGAATEQGKLDCFETADVWSCGVTLYVMLVGAYPFEDPADPKNFRKTIGRIVSVQYKIPEYVHISQDCRQLISRIFVANPARRITIREIRNHPWFLKNLPRELTEAQQAQYYKRDTPTYSLQSVEEIMRIVGEARTPPPSTTPVAGFGWTEEDDEEEGKQDQQENNEEEEEEEEEE